MGLAQLDICLNYRRHHLSDALSTVVSTQFRKLTVMKILISGASGLIGSALKPH